MPSRYRGRFGLACSSMMAQIKEQHGSSAKVSQPADITDDPIVAPHRISFKQYVLF
jgi:hypothetical protein